MTVAYKIKQYREEAGMTQEQLAKKSKVSRALIAGLESGAILETSTASLKKLAGALEKELKEIFF